VAVYVVYHNGAAAGPVVQFVPGGKTPLVHGGEDIVVGGHDGVLGLSCGNYPEFSFPRRQIVRLDAVLVISQTLKPMAMAGY
jgi:hypothetical protein